MNESNETEIDLPKVTSKLLHNKFKTKNQTRPSAKKECKYHQLVIDWKIISFCFFFFVFFFVSLETNIREFQYKILNDIVYTYD